MKKLDGRRHAYIDGVEVVTTSEICRLLDMTMTGKQIQDISGIFPVASINAANYWKTSDVPVIASMLACMLARFAANFQLILNNEKTK